MSIQELYSKKIDAACLILAGGQGKRLTPDKPLLKIDGIPIIERAAKVAVSLFEEVLVMTNTPGKYKFLGLPLAADDRRGCGPLMGIYSGLRRIEHEKAFVCAADMPFLDEALIRSNFRKPTISMSSSPGRRKGRSFCTPFTTNGACP
ncbi:MAG: molybdenum cofactor guanylyltransferase [Desulfobacterales bacterium]|nr:molybdenum cofactor guanylyltransferase [Desulfobacterales bacterium]